MLYVAVFLGGIAFALAGVGLMMQISAHSARANLELLRRQQPPSPPPTEAESDRPLSANDVQAAEVTRVRLIYKSRP